MSEISAYTAFKKDRAFYSEYDEELFQWGVFGDTTGFCYGLVSCEYAAEEKRLEKEATITAKYIIKDYIKFLLREGDYTEEELRKKVSDWLHSRGDKTSGQVTSAG